MIGLIFIGCIFAISLLGYIAFKISDYKLDKEFEMMFKKERDIKLRLRDSLETLCCQLNIKLNYVDDLGDAAGHILYHSNSGRLNLDKTCIEVLNKYRDDTSVLAHELGHYFAIKQREDTSEEGADTEAHRLCKAILNDQEQKNVEIWLRCMFSKRISA